jgi:hypothetical protein
MDQAKRRPTRLVDQGNPVHFQREDAFVRPDFHDEILGSEEHQIRACPIVREIFAADATI